MELGSLIVLPPEPLEINKHQLILHHPNSDDIYIMFDDRHMILNKDIEKIECKMLVISNPFYGVEVDRTGMPEPVYYDEDYYIINKYNFDISYMRAYRFGENQKKLAKNPEFLEDGSFDKSKLEKINTTSVVPLDYRVLAFFVADDLLENGEKNSDESNKIISILTTDFYLTEVFVSDSIYISIRNKYLASKELDLTSRGAFHQQLVTLEVKSAKFDSSSIVMCIT